MSVVCKHRLRSAIRSAMGGLVLIPLAGFAQEAAVAAASGPRTVLNEVIVFGRGEALIGKAGAASEGAVGGDDLLVRPMLRVADLLEAVPGLIAGQHSGSGKANQYFLRGFNLDHGTDFTTYIDDVPLNLRTHGHGQGYLDVNGLIPEVIERIDYRKGTYRADTGDFSMAGSAMMTTIDSLKPSFVAAESGSYGWGRLAGGGSTALGRGTLTLVGQYKTYDGPWSMPEDLQHQSVWGKYSQPTDVGMLKVSLSGYHGKWNSTEQLPESAIGTPGCVNEFCSLDPTARGETMRWILGSQLLANGWRATAYAQYYDWRMSSDPTYDYQIDQFDRRWTVGGRYERQLVQRDNLEWVAGAELRYDDIGNVGVDHTQQGERVENIGRNAVQEASIGIYSEATWRITDALRFTAGLRGNWYEFDVQVLEGSGLEGQNSVGRATSTNLTPKLGVAYAIGNNIELYGNWGRGAHSNDARAVVQKSLGVEGLASGTGYEAGARFEVGTLKLTAAYWWLNLSSELIFVGDSNAVEPRGASKRHGYELVAFWRPLTWLALDGVYTGSNASYNQAQDDGGYSIEGSVESAGELGVAAIKGPWEISARLRYLGPYPLVPNNNSPELNAENETMVNLRLAYQWRAITLYGEVLNAMDHKGKDIVYFYENAFDPDGGRVSRAEEPRTVRVGLKYEF